MPSDFADILALGRRLHDLSRFSFLPFEPKRIRRMFDLHIAEPRRRCGLIALSGSRSIGILAGYIETYRFCDHLVASDEIFFVDPARPSGWAAVRLLCAFRSWAIEAGAREIHVATATGIDPERTGRFLKRFNFEPIGVLYAQRLS